MPPGPGVAGSRLAVVSGAASSTSPPPSIENATEPVSSKLPASSIERYSTTWLPSPETVNDVSNGSSPAVFSDVCHSPVAPSVFTLY